MLKWFIKFIFICLFIGIVALSSGLVMIWSGAYILISPNLPSTTEINKIEHQTPLKIYSQEGTLIGKFGSNSHKAITYQEIHPQFLNAILAAEDGRFFEHKGADPKSLVRAILSYLNPKISLSGGSTITMQLAKLQYLKPEKTIIRKLNQIFLALHLELHHSKEDILELYLNTIYLGNHAYGIQSAAKIYYNKKLEALDLAQMAMIAGITKAPSVNNPLSNPEAALERRNWILKRMHQLNFIDYIDFVNATDKPITAQKHNVNDIKINDLFSYPVELARQRALKQLGKDAYTGHYSVYTTINTNLQRIAKEALTKGLHSYDDRHGYRGSEAEHLNPRDWQAILDKTPVINSLHPAIVSNVKPRSLIVLLKDASTTQINWNQGLSTARAFINSDQIGKNPRKAKDIAQQGDLIRLRKTSKGWMLAQIPKAQSAFIAIAPKNGKILAMIGGYDYKLSEFNRAVQAKRQPGSTIKPLVYAAAMELKGYTAASQINDKPLEYETHNGLWKPNNASDKFYGFTSFRKALYLSRNLVSIQLLEDLGIRNFLKYIKDFGIDTKNTPHNLSLALGSNNLSPQQVANIFADIANGGFHVQPHLISRIYKKDKLIYQKEAPVSCLLCTNPFSKDAKFTAHLTQQNETNNSTAATINSKSQLAKRNMDARVNYIIDNILSDVIEKGTAQDAKVLNRKDLRGKTGTTNGSVDAWFAGYNPEIAAVSWLGFDKDEKLGEKEFGGSAALPIWISFMSKALKNTPETFLPQPEGVVTLPINPQTGKIQARSSTITTPELFREEYAEMPPEESFLYPEDSIYDITLKEADNKPEVKIFDAKTGKYIIDDSFDETALPKKSSPTQPLYQPELNPKPEQKTPVKPIESTLSKELTSIGSNYKDKPLNAETVNALGETLQQEKKQIKIKRPTQREKIKPEGDEFIEYPAPEYIE